MVNISENCRCTVIGYGSWGTAIAKILLENCNEIGWHIINDTVRENIATNRVNPKYLSQVHFPKDKNIILYNDINDAVREADILIFAVPSAFLLSTLAPLTESLEDKMILSAIKGIVTNKEGEYVTITEYFNQVFGVKYDNLGVLTGPCHAEEIAMERLTYINVVCKDLKIADAIGAKFQCRYMQPNSITDIYGVEYAIVLKNIYALAVGICKGLNYGDNFMAVLISNSYYEIKEFLNSSYPFERDLTRSAYLGDLLVTAYSKFSRNRTFGLMIGQGCSIKTARRELDDMIAEGYYATECIHKIAIKKEINLPIADAVYQILYEKKSPKIIFEKLSTRLK